MLWEECASNIATSLCNWFFDYLYEAHAKEKTYFRNNSCPNYSEQSIFGKMQWQNKQLRYWNNLDIETKKNTFTLCVRLQTTKYICSQITHSSSSYIFIWTCNTVYNNCVNLNCRQYVKFANTYGAYSSKTHITF